MINVIGLGVGDVSSLGDAVKGCIKHSGVIIGSKRQHGLVDSLTSRTALLLNYPSPFAQLTTLLDAHRDKTITILASGDPLFFGIGAWLVQHQDPKKLHFYPNISSVQTAFSRIKMPWQNAKIISLHGRPLISIRPYLRNNCLYGVLTDQDSQPKDIAQELQKHGFEESLLWVCESLGSDSEKIRKFSVSEAINNRSHFHPLHITIVQTQGKGGVLPEFPGIQDELFETGSISGKGMITKKQVRLATLNLLQTEINDTCWDIGAGCGGLSVEWAYWNPHSVIYAIEDNQQRLKYLGINRQKFGVVKNLHIYAGTAPHTVLDDLPRPNKIFIGGSRESLYEILSICWEVYLKPQGSLVVSCVTETSKYEVMKFIEAYELQNNDEKIEVSTSAATSLAGKELLRPNLAVQLIKISKRVQ